MNRLLTLALSVAFASHAMAAPLPNEAVRTLPGGLKAVELPPGPTNPSARNTHLTLAHWRGGLVLPSYVIETSSGPRECFQPWVDDVCRDYKPGTDRRERAWVIKRGGQWLKCPRNDSAQNCVQYFALPLMLIQD
jgi:hypothetical protein